jgi:ribosomal protein S18 acetylase RimI-like enzyme
MTDDLDAGAVTFRFASTEDVADILALWEVAAENDGRPRDDAAKVAALIHRDATALELAVTGDRIVGSLISGWDGWRAHLYRLAVHPDARRSGIGRRLIARATDRLRALGASRVDAMVLEHNDLGQSIWVAEGFAAQPDWRRWVRPTSV